MVQASLERLWTWANQPQPSSDSEDSENFEEGLDFHEESEDNTIESEKGRRLSESLVNQAASVLQDSFRQDQVVENTNSVDHFSPVQVRFPVNAPALRPPPTMPTVNYDALHEEGEADNAMDKAINALKNKEWGEDDLQFYFQQVEIQMKKAGVKNNFTKLQVLSTVLPKKVSDEIKSILRKQESEFPRRDAYLQAKTEILKTFGPTEGANCERALSRVLSGKPSQLCKALIDDLCSKELKQCCCIKMVGTLWRRALPSSVKQAVAHYDFTPTNLPQILQIADDVYMSTRPPQALSVAAVSLNPSANPPTTAPPGEAPEEFLNQAFWIPPTAPPEHTAQMAQAAQIAALYKNSNRGRGARNGNRGGGGNNGGGGQNNKGGQQNYSAANPRWKTPRNPDLPPYGACKRHWQFGKSSFVCLEPTSCPWRKFTQPKPNN